MRLLLPFYLALLAPPALPDRCLAQESGLRSRWGREPALPAHPEHPRPTLFRPTWRSLNGSWEWAVTDLDASAPAAWSGRIEVPFPLESALSGVGRHLCPDELLWYRRRFRAPAEWRGRRLLLHFGAVDWRATVFLDGRRLGVHEGGYDPFSFDLGPAAGDGAEHEITVSVWDPTDAGGQPRGKQVSRPGGIWYTPTSGIWQTVWLEAVPARAWIDRVRVEGSFLRGEARIRLRLGGDADGCLVEARASLDGRTAAVARARTTDLRAAPLVLRIPEPRAWSPDSPTLYDLDLILRRDGEEIDRAASYFGLRDIAVGPDRAGVARLLLNGQPLFQLGALDQGFWPDGLYTAPSDEALRSDLELLKDLGFNLVRKHVKVEPERWYAWCDRLGLLVWQDMPSGGPSIGPNDPDAERSEEDKAVFYRELGELIEDFGGHPCLVMWVPFNEGWGQFDTAEVVAWIRARDPTRLIDAASGWADRGVGDVHDLHSYPGPAIPPLEPRRAAVLGEFGGLGLPLAGHTWQEEANWGYRNFASREELTAAYAALAARLRPLVAEGLCAAVYTQTSDVEIEVNGLLTYDREILKPDAAAVRAANRRLFLPPPEIETLLPASRRRPATWAWTLTEPPPGWEQPDFDDSAWARGPGGFGRAGTPGAVIGTEWTGDRIWLRRSFVWRGPLPAGAPHLLIHHDEDAEVWLNGVLLARLPGYTTSYELAPLGPEFRSALRQGRNVLAVRCRQTAGGQFIDAGLVLVREPADGEEEEE
ncbi:MAG: hypothetical protein D6702_12755 [Planctomycetota bacterium]|nr:MAG: hypothetical protein D6702_12755 [Planctomycetota bacterium]